MSCSNTSTAAGGSNALATATIIEGEYKEGNASAALAEVVPDNVYIATLCSSRIDFTSWKLIKPNANDVLNVTLLCDTRRTKTR